MDSPYLLSGLLRCRVYGRPCSAQGAKSNQFAYYICGTLFREGAGTCGARYLNAPKGNLIHSADTRHLQRSIPAGAGEPALGDMGVDLRGVYPRGCGGTVGSRSSALKYRGLSPRVRGNPRVVRLMPKALGSIPAGAGEPRRTFGIRA